MQEPTLETVTRETIETFRGQRTECKVTTQTTDYESTCPPDIIEALADKATKAASNKSSGVNKVKATTKLHQVLTLVQPTEKEESKNGIPK